MDIFSVVVQPSGEGDYRASLLLCELDTTEAELGEANARGTTVLDAVLRLARFLLTVGYRGELFAEYADTGSILVSCEPAKVTVKSHREPAKQHSS